MEKVVVFLDFANVDRAASERGYPMDYANLLHYFREGRFLVEAYCYLPINPRNPYAHDEIRDELWEQGYIVRDKMGTPAGDSYKCNQDLEITLEMMRVAHELSPEIIVLASGDGDFVPVVLALRQRGIRVEVAAFPDCAVRQLVLKSSGFIDLEWYVEELEAVQEGLGDSVESATPETAPMTTVRADAALPETASVVDQAMGADEIPTASEPGPTVIPESESPQP